LAAADDERARRFDALFRAHSPDIIAYCLWRARSHSDAQDALAEVFLVAWRRLDDVPPGDAARIWLYATARRVIANQWRSIGRREQLQTRLSAQPVTLQAAGPLDDPTVDLVHTALRRLSPGDQEVLLLAEWEDLSPAAIAAVMRCSGVAARGRLHRARRRFRKTYEELQACADSTAGRRPTQPAAHGPDSRPAQIVEARAEGART
jgi:RNA polymerase sigma-70 factor (ECF subfamily)